eukprot:364988-Chlamydomonas_euryale.AAC.30
MHVLLAAMSAEEAREPGVDGGAHVHDAEEARRPRVDAAGRQDHSSGRKRGSRRSSGGGSASVDGQSDDAAGHGSVGGRADGEDDNSGSEGLDATRARLVAMLSGAQPQAPAQSRAPGPPEDVGEADAGVLGWSYSSDVWG